MINVNADTRLTDELERKLMAQAIEEQFRFKPVVSLKKLFARLTGAMDSVKATNTGNPVQSAS